jgi:hypothetical protein
MQNEELPYLHAPLNIRNVMKPRKYIRHELQHACMGEILNIYSYILLVGKTKGIIYFGRHRHR